MLSEVAVVLFESGQVVPVAQFAVGVSAALVSVVVVAVVVAAAAAVVVVAVAELVDWQVVGNTVFDLAALRYFL